MKHILVVERATIKKIMGCYVDHDATVLQLFLAKKAVKATIVVRP